MVLDPISIMGVAFAFVSAVQSGAHIIRRMWDGLKRYFGHTHTTMSMSLLVYFMLAKIIRCLTA